MRFKDIRNRTISVDVSRGIISLDCEEFQVVPRPIGLTAAEFIKVVEFVVAGYGGELTEESWAAFKEKSRLPPATSAT